jgi:hypothetical protein
MKVNALKLCLKRYFLNTRSDIATIPKDLYKTHVKKAAVFGVNKKVKK